MISKQEAYNILDIGRNNLQHESLPQVLDFVKKELPAEYDKLSREFFQIRLIIADMLKHEEAERRQLKLEL